MKGGQLHKHREPVGRDLPLHLPEIAWSLLLLASRDNKEVLNEGNKAIPMDYEEGDFVEPLGVSPRENAKEIMGRPPGLGPGSNDEVNGGT